MTYPFSADQEDLRRNIRRFLSDKSPEAEVRRLMDDSVGYDGAVWELMAQQLHLPGMVIPEAHGGAGYSQVELIVAMEEMGRALLCSPYFATVAMASNLLLATSDEAAKESYLPALAEGRLTATVALAEEAGRWDEAGIAAQAENADGTWRLSGEKRYVVDGHTAELILVVARTKAGISLFAVDSGAEGFAAVPVSAMDQTRKLATLTFTRAPAQLVGADGHGWGAVSEMLDLTAIALAAEQVGGAQRVLDMSVEYAKTRVQFGRPIGSFQAIKHKCADMLVEVESARSIAYHAGWAAARGSDEVPELASLAKSYCSEAYFRCASENIQIHGGIGYTWEHPAHLYFKRAKSSELLFGDPTHHRELLAQRIGI